MAGVNRDDVWQAADAILLAGERPTIERVRLKIGRGSPNTVSPMLDTWYRDLGARISDPKAFAASPELPDPVQQAAKYLWEAAQAETRRDFDQRLQEGLAAAVANVEAEKSRAATAEAAAFEASNRASHLQADKVQLAQQLDQARLALTSAEATLAQMSTQNTELKQQVTSARVDATAAGERAERSMAEAIERLTAVERRAALEIDNERQAKAAAVKRAEAFEKRLEAAQQELQAERLARREEQVKAQVQADSAARDATRLETELRQQSQLVEGLRGQLNEARRDADVARAEAAAAHRLATSSKPATKRAMAARKTR